MKENRSNFTGRIGFILAAAGSAIGLGNLWRFPYLAAKYGGGTFLLIYILLAVTFGFALMTAEIGLGRKTRLSAIGAFKSLDKRFGFLGVLASIVPAIILPYYAVIGGWVLKYFVACVSGNVSGAASDSYFGGFVSSVGEPILWFVLFVVFTAGVVIFGVEKGIENVSKFLMPILVVLTLFICGYVLTRPGAAAGIRYYLLPHMSDVSIKTFLAAVGQLFYSMSLAMGIMITYGSYMKKEDSLEGSVRQIELFDTGFAFFAGLMIIPSVFIFSGGDASVLNSGPSLMFVTLPKVFNDMAFGGVIGTVFFLLVFFAALTSSISLMETIVSILMDRFNWSRRMTCVIVFVFVLLMGIPSSLGFGLWADFKPLGMDILSAWDFLSNSVLMPIVALITCIFVGYVIKPKAIIDEAQEGGHSFKHKGLFVVMTKWIAPIFLAAILISSILSAFGLFKI